MVKSLQIYLSHVLESAGLIEKRIKGITYEEFVGSIDLQDMVIRRLEIIGEAVRQIPKETRESYPDID